MWVNAYADVCAADIAAAADAPSERYDSADGQVLWVRPGTTDLHRLDGPAKYLVEVQEEWWVAGHRHRVDGPAQTLPSRMQWWVNGVQHRLDGPAVLESDGPDEWWVNGRQVEEATDCAELDRMYAAGKLAELEMVLSLWRPGGPTTVELCQAVRAASS